MNTTRRDFIKGLGASAVVLYASDIIGNLLAQSPPGKPMQSKFKGLADIVLGEAKMQGCSYADVRFTRTINIQGANATYNSGRGGGAGAGCRRGRRMSRGGDVPPDLAGGGGGGGGGRRRRRGPRRWAWRRRRTWWARRWWQ